MRLTFLGTGTSFGVPVVGCRCPTCTSTDPRDRRTRHAALLTTDGGRLLVDTPPELRLQLLRAGVESLDAVWYTHLHADHVHGIDDLRIFSLRARGRPVPAYLPAHDRRSLEHRFPYIFDPDALPAPGTSRPEIRLHTYRAGEAVQIVGRRFVPLAVPHGSMTVYGFRCGALGYITDAKRLPPDTFEALRGVRVLVLNALWFGNPHPSHFNVEEAVETADQVGAERTFLTHLTHRVGHRELLERLPDHVRPAHDGLSVEIPEGGDGEGRVIVAEEVPEDAEGETGEERTARQEERGRREGRGRREEGRESRREGSGAGGAEGSGQREEDGTRRADDGDRQEDAGRRQAPEARGGSR